MVRDSEVHSNVIIRISPIQRCVSEMHVLLVWLALLALLDMVVFLLYKINFNFVKIDSFES